MRAEWVNRGSRGEFDPGGRWGRREGESNRRVGWCCAVMGALSGLVMGLWSFDGPVATPGWLGDYGATPRRLARLGHIAFFGLGMLNLLLARELGQTSLGGMGRRVASWAMNFGNVWLPVALFAAAWWAPLKYLFPGPARGVGVALGLAAFGAVIQPRGGALWGQVGPGGREGKGAAR